MEQQSNIVGGPKSKALGPGPEVMAASTLEGNDVYNAAGESLGDIKAIMLDVPRGRVAYAVLARRRAGDGENCSPFRGRR